MTSEEREAQAKQRFIFLSITRFVSVLLVMVGMTILSDRYVQGLEIVGYILIVLGAVEFFVMPIILKKNWAKQDAQKAE
jgi:Na+/melibiose symporter-like transporter